MGLLSRIKSHQKDSGQSRAAATPTQVVSLTTSISPISPTSPTSPTSPVETRATPNVRPVSSITSITSTNTTTISSSLTNTTAASTSNTSTSNLSSSLPSYASASTSRSHPVPTRRASAIDTRTNPNSSAELQNAAPIPSYETALRESAAGLRPTTTTRSPSDYFGTSAPTRYETVFEEDDTNNRTHTIHGNEGLGEEDDDGDDPLTPRPARPTPIPILRPLRRNTFAAISELGERSGGFAYRPRVIPEAGEGGVESSSENQQNNGESQEDGDGENTSIPPLVEGGEGVDPVPSDDRPSLPPEESSPSATATVAPGGAILELPAPPPNALPAYSAHLASDEMRLISTVHLDQNHPAAAFFSALATSSVSAAPEPPADPQPSQRETIYTTGGKKLRLNLTKGGVRMNVNGTGPLYCKVGRFGVIEGTVEVGKVDHGQSLEVAIIGLVNTSYYVRGQYTLIDTLPLVRRVVKLWPTDANPDDTLDPLAPDFESPSTRPTAATSETTEANTSTSTTTSPQIITDASGVPLAPTISKDGESFLTPGMVLPFSITMPNTHYRGNGVELPPSCQIYQVGLQAGIEYILRIRLSRKGWRMNESLTMPVVYEPRAYITPRRLRALTTDDALNPGWRTIRLHGGAATVPTDPGVEGNLLLPSPPILYIASEIEPPPIPFHIHFHSPLTHPLSTFSDPLQSNFIVRLMRVATMRIGAEREIRRMEVPSKVVIWQEGGPKFTLGEDTPKPNNTTTRPTKTRRRSSFLLRRSSTVEPTPPTPAATTSATDTIQEVPPPQVSPFTPLAFGSTDVHILGELTIQPRFGGTDIVRRLIQSFTTTEIGINYVLEIGISPKEGSVKENFSHLWGGGLIEVVVGEHTRRGVTI